MKRLVLLLAVSAMAAGLTACSGAPQAKRDVQVTSAEGAAPAKPPEDKWKRWDREGPRMLRTTVGSYFRSRVYDFTDMFEAGLSFGKWAKVEADYLIGFYGFGATDLQRWRLGQRSFILNEETTTVCTLPFPASLILFPAMYMDDEAWGTITAFGGVCYEWETALWPDPAFANIPPTEERIRIAAIERDPKSNRFIATGHSFPVGAEAHLLLGARARVYPLQIADFVTSLFGWDLLHDDIRPFGPMAERK